VLPVLSGPEVGVVSVLADVVVGDVPLFEVDVGLVVVGVVSVVVNVVSPEEPLASVSVAVTSPTGGRV
jgi:hypothetical protein